MLQERLELSRLSALDPKSSVYCQFHHWSNCCKQLRYIRIVRFSSSTQLTLSIDYHVLYNVDDLCLRPYCIKYLQFVG